MTIATCPECGYKIKLRGQPYEGQQVVCHECRASLEVISLKPLELDWAFDEPTEDWDEDWDLGEGWDFDDDWDDGFVIGEDWSEDLVSSNGHDEWLSDEETGDDLDVELEDF